MRFVTDADVSFQNHADIVGTISNGKGDWAAFRVLYHFNDLKCSKTEGQTF